MEFIILDFKTVNGKDKNGNIVKSNKKPSKVFSEIEINGKTINMLTFYSNENIFYSMENMAFLKLLRKGLKEAKFQGNTILILSDEINISSVKRIVYDEFGFLQCSGSVVKSTFTNLIIKAALEHEIDGFKEEIICSEEEWGIVFEDFDEHIGYLISLMAKYLRYISLFSNSSVRLSNFEYDLYAKTGISLNTKDINDEYINAIGKIIYIGNETFKSQKFQGKIYNICEIINNVVITFSPVEEMSILKRYFSNINVEQVEFFVLATNYKQYLKTINGIEKSGFLLKKVKVTNK